MRSSTSFFDQRIQQNRMLSWWFAGDAVRGDVSLDDFLIYWLCYYLAYGRYSPFPLPFAVVIEQGKPIKIPNPAYDTFWDLSHEGLTGEDLVEHFNTETKRLEITRELEKIEAEISRLTHSQHVIHEQQETLEADEVEAIGRGDVHGPTTRGRHTVTRRRPRLPFPWRPIADYLAIALMILFEAYQLGLPYLDSIGVDTTRLGREWHFNPVGVLSGAGFALAATAGLFYVWYLLICFAVALSRSWDSDAPVVIVRRVAGIFFLCCGLLVATICIANLRHSTTNKIIDVQALQHGQASGTDMGIGVFVVLTLIVPFTAASLHYTLGQSAYWQIRRDIVAKQAQWDREEDERLVPAETFADRMALLQQRRAGIEQARTRLQNERRALAERASAAEQQRLERLEQARQGSVVFANRLIAALEEKRFYFLRAANRAKKFHLLPDAARDQSQARTKPRPFVPGLLPDRRNGHEA
jgi:hypothetical protein